MKTSIVAIVLTASLMLAFCGTTYAQSSDALLNKLVEKGILSTTEADELRAETDNNPPQTHSVKSQMPDWVNSLNFAGDLRLRYDGIYNGDPDFVNRNRFRYRLRFGATLLLKENFEMGFRLTSGDNGRSGFTSLNPISDDSTFQDNGSKKLIGVDWAYLKWSPTTTTDWTAVITGGKMENPFVLSEMIFDSDYTPEGLGEQFGYTINEKQTAKLNLGQFILDEERQSSSDPFLFGAQVRLESVWNSKWQSTLGISALMIGGAQNLVTTNVPDQNKGNTRINLNAGTTNSPNYGPLAYNFNPIIVDGAVIYTLDYFPTYPGSFPIRFAADYANNPAVSDNNQAFSIGFTLGKSGRKGAWDLTYKYKYLESDYWYEELVDSDMGAFYKTGIPQSGGTTGYQPGTNVRGHFLRATYSPYDPLTLSATYYLFNLLQGKSKDSETSRLLIDASLRF